MRLMQLYRVSVQLLLGLLFERNFTVRFRRNSAFVSSKCMADIRYYIFFVGFVTVKL